MVRYQYSVIPYSLHVYLICGYNLDTKFMVSIKRTFLETFFTDLRIQTPIEPNPDSGFGSFTRMVHLNQIGLVVHTPMNEEILK